MSYARIPSRPNGLRVAVAAQTKRIVTLAVITAAVTCCSGSKTNAVDGGSTDASTDTSVTVRGAPYHARGAKPGELRSTAASFSCPMTNSPALSANAACLSGITIAAIAPRTRASA